MSYYDPDGMSDWNGPRKTLTSMKQRLLHLLLGVVVVALAGTGAWFTASTRPWYWIAFLLVAAVVLLAIAGLKLGAAKLRTVDISLFVSLIVSTLVWIGIGRMFPIAEFQVQPDVFVDNCPVRIVHQGQVLSPTGTDGTTYRYRGEGVEGELVVETLGADGWTKREFALYSRDLALKQMSTTELYIDNRGLPEKTLMCGELPLHVATNFVGRVRIPSPKKTIHLLVDGKDVGTFADGRYAIDVSGKHSYRLSEIVYVSGMLQAMANMGMLRVNQDDPFNPAFERSRPKLDLPVPNEPVLFTAKHVHRLPKQIDFFLTPHPEKVETYYQDSIIKTEFIDAN